MPVPRLHEAEGPGCYRARKKETTSSASALRDQILRHGSDFIYTNFSRGRDPEIRMGAILIIMSIFIEEILLKIAICIKENAFCGAKLRFARLNAAEKTRKGAAGPEMVPVRALWQAAASASLYSVVGKIIWRAIEHLS